MNKDHMRSESADSDMSLPYEAVSPTVLCNNSTGGNSGESSSSKGNDKDNDDDDPEEGDIEMPNDPTTPQTPTVGEYMKHKTTHIPFYILVSNLC